MTDGAGHDHTGEQRPSTHPEESELGISRRTLLRRGAAVGAGVAWATPMVTRFTPPAFAVASPRPPQGVEPRTIGFWTNHASCSRSRGNQDPVLDETLEGFDSGGVMIGSLFVDTCDEAVHLLSKEDLDGNGRADDAAYRLAAQLLGALLNKQAGAVVCSEADRAITEGLGILGDIGFDGTGPTGASPEQNSRMSHLAEVLDRYNNGRLC